MSEQKQEIPFFEGDWRSMKGIHRFSHEAMATTFECIIHYDDALYARQAAEAAFDELDRIEGELSRFIENSDIARINNLPAGQPLRVGLDAFECLRLSKRICDETNGAFDITIGLLFKCWLDKDKKLRSPSEQEIEFARERTGAHLLKLDEVEHTVVLARSGVQVDLGGVGKGYGLDRMAELLREWSIDAALIHGGFSSVLALDGPGGTKGWPVTLSHPAERKKRLARIYLSNCAISGSGLQKGRHIIDTRTARPVEARMTAWACARDAAVSDALSTAFMVMTPGEIENYCERHRDVSAMIVPQVEEKEAGDEKILRFGRWKEGEPLL